MFCIYIYTWYMLYIYICILFNSTFFFGISAGDDLCRLQELSCFREHRGMVGMAVPGKRSERRRCGGAPLGRFGGWEEVGWGDTYKEKSRRVNDDWEGFVSVSFGCFLFCVIFLLGHGEDFLRTKIAMCGLVAGKRRGHFTIENHLPVIYHFFE